jgi:hypothetical protein
MPELKQPEIWYPIFEPTSGDIRSRLAGLENSLIQRAIAKGIIRDPSEAKVRPLTAQDLDSTKPSEAFSHSFSASNTWEKYVDAKTVGDMVITIVGLANLSDSPKLLDVRFGVGTPVRSKFQTGLLTPMYVQEEKKVLFTKDVEYDKGDKVTIEVLGSATGTEDFALIGLVCEKA